MTNEEKVRIADAVQALYDALCAPGTRETEQAVEFLDLCVGDLRAKRVLNKDGEADIEVTDAERRALATVGRTGSVFGIPQRISMTLETKGLVRILPRDGAGPRRRELTDAGRAALVTS